MRPPCFIGVLVVVAMTLVPFALYHVRTSWQAAGVEEQQEPRTFFRFFLLLLLIALSSFSLSLPLSEEEQEKENEGVFFLFFLLVVVSTWIFSVDWPVFVDQRETNSDITLIVRRRLCVA